MRVNCPVFAVLFVLAVGIATGVEVSAEYPGVPAYVNEVQGTTPSE